MTDADRARTSEALLAKLQKQQGCFTKHCTSRDAAAKTSFVISRKITPKSKPFSEGERVFGGLCCARVQRKVGRSKKDRPTFLW